MQLLTSVPRGGYLFVAPSNAKCQFAPKRAIHSTDRPLCVLPPLAPCITIRAIENILPNHTIEIRYRHREKVERIRAIEDKAERDKIKATLPGITVSGVFSTRAIAGLVKHSGLICIDIDYKDNQQVENYGELKQILSTAPFVAYCGMSVSGTGYFVVIPIKYPGKHDMQFEALHRMYERLGVNIDISGKDVSRLRGYSWDSKAYINHEANPYDKVYEEPQLVKLSVNINKYARKSGNDTRTWVEKYINAISAKGIDITEGYKQWLRLGFAFATEFGEAGRQYFHDVSRNYSGYKSDAADKQYTHCLNSRGHGVTIKTFFYLCKAQGVKP